MSRILIIEDEAILREEIEELLQFEGFEVSSAENGEAGVKLAEAMLPDLIISDIMMPVMDGYQVLEHLRKNRKTRHIPFLFLTAKADKSFMRQGMELGADDYLTKPFTRIELIGAIQSRLERSRALTGLHREELRQAKARLSQLVAQQIEPLAQSIALVRDILSRQMDYLSPAEIDDLMNTLHSGTEHLGYMAEQMRYVNRLESGALSAEQIATSGRPVDIWLVLMSAIDQAHRLSLSSAEMPVMLAHRVLSLFVRAEMMALKYALAEVLASLMETAGTEALSVKVVRAEQAVQIRIQPQRRTVETAPVAGAASPQRTFGLTLARRILEVHGGKLKYPPAAAPDKPALIRLPLFTESQSM